MTFTSEELAVDVKQNKTNDPNRRQPAPSLEPAMNELKTRLDRRSEAFVANERAMAELVADLRAKTTVATTGGGAAAREKHLILQPADPPVNEEEWLL